MMTVTLFTQGYFGARLVEKLEAASVKYIVYTYASDATRRTADKPYLREGYPYRYIHERSFDPERIAFSEDSLVFCADWTKDFFHYLSPLPPVWHIHPSLLPGYRGYGAVSEQFLRGIAISGVTLYKDNCHIDGGDILYQEAIRVGHNDWPEDFIEKVTEVAAQWITRMTLGEIPAGIPQESERAFYTQRKRTKQGLIDFNLSALSIYNQIRAYSRPFFGAYFVFNNQQIKVWRALCEKWSGVYGTPGEVIARGPQGVEIACGEGSIVFTETESAAGVEKYDSITIEGRIK